MKAQDIQILIFSGGKTASSTLYWSFVKLNQFALQTHCDYFTAQCLKLDMTIHDIIEAERKEKLLIISCYREPISRTLSSLFEQYQGIFKIQANNEVQAMKIFNQIDNSLIREQFIRFLKNGFEDYHPNCDKLYKGQDLGSYIDIYKYPYNRNQGYQIYETEKFKWIYLRFDKIGNFEKIIRENTKYKNFEFTNQNQNLSQDKLYYEKYLQAQKFSIPKNLLDLCFKRDEKNLNYFYTPSEINAIKEKWYAHACLEDK